MTASQVCPYIRILTLPALNMNLRAGLHNITNEEEGFSWPQIKDQASYLHLQQVTYIICLLFCCTFFLFCKGVNAQISSGGTPTSFTEALPGNIDSQVMQPVNVDSLLAEDVLEEERGLPPRFGFALDVDLGLNNAGTWHALPDGGRIWRLRIVVPGAFSINLIYDDFRLPFGATFFLYNEDTSMVIGGFTERNNKAHGKFSTAPVKGSVSILEYYEPANTQQPGVIHISKIIHGYKNFFKSQGGTKNHAVGFGASHNCNNNVRCPEGQPWLDERRSVAMVLLSDNTRWCSGSLLNNVGEDLTPYFLTAFHCADTNDDDVLSSAEKADAETWIFMFKYESSTCSNPSTEPSTNYTISASTFRAALFDSDFLLLELSQKPPTSYEPFWNGWSNIDTAPGSSVCIHHPSGDIKKISFDDDPAVSDEYGPRPGAYPADSHWRVIWDDGTTERGSSGSPLYDPNHRVVGQLHGGPASCDNPDGADYYGKFSMSWNRGSSSSSRLKDWLDPDNTGAATLDGMDDPRPDPPTNLYISGYIGNYPTVNWTASASNDVDYYRVYRRTYLYPTWQVLATTTNTYYVNTDYIISSAGDADDQFFYKATAVDLDGWESDFSNTDNVYGKYDTPWKINTTDSMQARLPTSYSLDINYPNPFNPTTTIRYALPEDSFTELRIYDLLGREIRTLVNGNEAAGYKKVQWDGKDSLGNPASSGMYVYQLLARSRESKLLFTQTRKMILLR